MHKVRKDKKDMRKPSKLELWIERHPVASLIILYAFILAFVGAFWSAVIYVGATIVKSVFGW